MRIAFWVSVTLALCKCTWEILTTHENSPFKPTGVKIGASKYQVFDRSETVQLVLAKYKIEDGWIEFPFLVPEIPKMKWVWSYIPEEFLHNDEITYLYGLLMCTGENNGIMLVLNSVFFFIQVYTEGLFGFHDPQIVILFLRGGIFLFSFKVKELLIMWAHAHLREIQGTNYLVGGTEPLFEDDKLLFLAYQIISILDTPFL